jgi:hypothetical protein
MPPRKPQTIPEYRRLAHAFLAGSRYPAGSTVYVIMSILAPLYRVQGVFSGLRETEAVLAAPVPRELGWTEAEAAARQIIEADVPETPDFDRVSILGKDEWTGETLAVSDPGYPGERRSRDIESMELVINYTKGSVRYAIGKQVAAIFITRGAAEMFLLPHALDTFGHVYEAALRSWIDERTAVGTTTVPLTTTTERRRPTPRKKRRRR